MPHVVRRVNNTGIHVASKINAILELEKYMSSV